MTYKGSRILDKYIAGEFLFSFFVSFLFFFFMFFLNQILLMAEDILAKRIPLVPVVLLILYSLPSIIALAFPFATLTGALMAFGRLSSDNEILAMKASGFRRGAVFRSVLALGALFALISFGVNDILLPAGSKAFGRLYRELIFRHPGLELEPYAVRRYRDAVIITGEVDDQGVRPLIIIERRPGGDRSLIIAAEATTSARSNQEPGLRMSGIFNLVPDVRKRESWSWATAERMEYRFLIDEGSGAISLEPGPREMRSGQVRRVIVEKEGRHETRLAAHMGNESETVAELEWALRDIASGDVGETYHQARSRLENLLASIDDLRIRRPKDRSLQIWKLEFFQKFAIPFACLPFVVLAYPLGLLARRSGRAVGFGIGLLMTAVYWALLVGGRTLGLRTDVPPALVMIVPDIVLLVVGGVLYFGGRRR